MLQISKYRYLTIGVSDHIVTTSTAVFKKRIYFVKSVIILIPFNIIQGISFINIRFLLIIFFYI